jgi:hypothetical protein
VKDVKFNNDGEEMTRLPGQPQTAEDLPGAGLEVEEPVVEDEPEQSVI